MTYSCRQKLGKKIRNIRESRHLTQEALALLCGFSGAYMGMIERAENDFKISKLFKIANALKIEVKDLFDFED